MADLFFAKNDPFEQNPGLVTFGSSTAICGVNCFRYSLVNEPPGFSAEARIGWIEVRYGRSLPFRKP